MKTTLDLTDPRHMSLEWNRSVIMHMKQGEIYLTEQITKIKSLIPSLLQDSDYNGYEHYSDQIELMEEALCRLQS